MEIERRRSALGALERSARTWRGMLDVAGTIPERSRSRFFYEGGYIEMLLGHHLTAREHFRSSLEAIDKSTPRWEAKWAAGASLLVQVSLVLNGRSVAARSIADELTRDALAALDGAASDDVGAKRWRTNWMWNAVRVNDALGRSARAGEALERAETHYRSLTALDGWSGPGSVTRRIIHGSMKAKNPIGDPAEALFYLTRALVLLVGRSRQLPEMLRDLRRPNFTDS